MRVLAVGSNPLTELPPSCAALTQLETLDLSDTRLAAVPGWWRDLPALRTLNLGFGQQMSREVARQALELTQLTSLSLDRHKIAELWEGVGRLSGLRSLDLAYNELTRLPDALFALQGLEALNLSGNGALVAPAQLTRLAGLRRLPRPAHGRHADRPLRPAARSR